MTIHPGHLREYIISTTLRELGLYSEAAEELLMLTAAAESECGRWLWAFCGHRILTVSHGWACVGEGVRLWSNKNSCLQWLPALIMLCSVRFIVPRLTGCDNPHQRNSTIQARAVVSNIVSNTDATLKLITGRT